MKAQADTNRKTVRAEYQTRYRENDSKTGLQAANPSGQLGLMMLRRQGVCVFTGPTSVMQSLSPTHREGGATLLAPGHVWWPGVQPPLHLNQSPPTQLGLAPVLFRAAHQMPTLDTHVLTECGTEGQPPPPQIIPTLCGGNPPGSSQKPPFCFPFCSISCRTDGGNNPGRLRLSMGFIWKILSFARRNRLSSSNQHSQQPPRRPQSSSRHNTPGFKEMVRHILTGAQQECFLKGVAGPGKVTPTTVPVLRRG